MNATITLDKVLQRVGLRALSTTHRHDLYPSTEGLREREAPRFGLLVYWPRELHYLSVRVSQGGHTFQEGRDGVRQAAAAAQCDSDDLFTPGDHQSYRVLAGVVDRQQRLSVEVTVDTDDSRFCEVAGQELTLNLNLRAFHGPFDEAGTLTLLLRPGGEPPDFHGHVALDLGNTCSTLALLHAGEHDADRTEILDADSPKAECGADAPPVPSHVRLEQVVGEVSDDPDSVRWVIGQVAASGGTDGLILGAKRLAVGLDWDREQYAYLRLKSATDPDGPGQRQPVPIRNRLPAELLACRIYQRFSAATFERVASIALTYPTTLSARELSRLRQVVYRGWLRMRGVHPQPAAEEDCAAESRKHIELNLDEASAAAFFFLNKIVKATLGARRFQYLYPDGLNLLLYDCGGGTTDIALVSARTDTANARKLQVRVLGRTGLRHFGGDDITREVFRVFKAKVGARVAEFRNNPKKVNFPASPVGRAELDKLLSGQADDINRLVPTRFDPDNWDDENRTYRRHTLELWNWAEEVKKQFQAAGGKGGPDGAVNFIPPLGGELIEHLQGGANKEQVSRLRDMLRAIRINRWEIDRLIEEPLLTSIANCNRLIASRLGDAGGEVHRVVVAGNAARYPFVRELLQKDLDVSFLKDRFEFDESNLKHAVAKGAVLALALKTEAVGLDVEWDSDLSNRYLYDVAYFDRQLGAHRILFKENEPFNEEKRMYIKAFHKEGEDPRDVFLYRRWPGEKEFRPYLRYRFRHRVDRLITVRYDSREEFVVEEEEGTKGELSEVVDQKGTYLPPVQRGDI